MLNPLKWAERKIAMGMIEKMLAGFIERSCKNWITTIVGVLSVAIFAYNTFAGMIPAQYRDGVNLAASILAGVALLLAKDGDQPASIIPDVKKLGLILLLIGMGAMCAGRVQAQTVGQTAATLLPPAPSSDGVQNLYAAGVSYSVNASPAVAGTALYAHQVNTSGTYAFTVVDALPATLKPFTVTSNIGIGVAQKIMTFGKVGIYMPTAAGISWSGTNTGWQWNGGALAFVPLKNGYYLVPTVRFLKSSVSSGSGYQPIVGLLFGWGK